MLDIRRVTLINLYARAGVIFEGVRTYIYTRETEYNALCKFPGVKNRIKIRSAK